MQCGTHRAFVAGATGYTGNAVVAALVARDVKVFAHIRPDSPRLARWQTEFSRLGAEPDHTPWEAEALTTRLAELAPTLVFGLLGTTRHRMRRSGSTGGSTENYAKVDYGLTAMLLDASRACETRPRFVYLSAMGVRPGARSPYMRARAQLEARLAGTTLPWTIVRPGFITGPDRPESRHMERIAARGVDAVAGFLGRLGANRAALRYRSLTGPDLANALVELALDPSAAGRIVLAEEIPRQTRP